MLLPTLNGQKTVFEYLLLLYVHYPLLNYFLPFQKSKIILQMIVRGFFGLDGKLFFAHFKEVNNFSK
jgi:hypothetical protein